MTYIRFKHIVEGDAIEIAMQADTSMQFESTTEDGLINEQLDIEDGVLRLIITTKSIDEGCELTYSVELHCSLDRLTENDGYPLWYQAGSRRNDDELQSMG